MCEETQPSSENSDWTRLGVSPGASKEEIDRAFKVSVRADHPDAGGSGQVDMDELKKSRDRLRKISENESRAAHYTPAARARYDQWDKFMAEQQPLESSETIHFPEEQWKVIAAAYEVARSPEPITLETSHGANEPGYQIGKSEAGAQDFQIARQVTDWNRDNETIEDYGDKPPGGANNPVRTVKKDVFLPFADIHRQGESGHMNFRVPQGALATANSLVKIGQSLASPEQHDPQEIKTHIKHVHAENRYRRIYEREAVKIERTFHTGGDISKLRDGIAYYQGRSRVITD